MVLYLKLALKNWKIQVGDGIDDVKFLIKTNPKSELGHLNKITSGGELCRFALAIKVVSSKTKKFNCF